jgi:hypothetical protein
MSAFEIVNSRVGTGKYEASDSPFLWSGRKSPTRKCLKLRVNMGKRNLWASEIVLPYCTTELRSSLSSQTKGFYFSTL